MSPYGQYVRLAKGLELLIRPHASHLAPDRWIWSDNTQRWSGNCPLSRIKSTSMEHASRYGNAHHRTSHMTMTKHTVLHLYSFQSFNVLTKRFRHCSWKCQEGYLACSSHFERFTSTGQTQCGITVKTKNDSSTRSCCFRYVHSNKPVWMQSLVERYRGKAGMPFKAIGRIFRKIISFCWSLEYLLHATRHNLRTSKDHF